jgi:hypothetical protein
MRTILKNDLYTSLNRLNSTLGTGSGTVTHTPLIGEYLLQQAYGGFQLQQRMNDSGGVRSISSGYISKREMYTYLQAVLTGINLSRQHS